MQHAQAFLHDYALICSFLPNQKDPDTGEEPNDLELWMLTHSKQGIWTNQASRDVYVSV